MFQKKRIEKHEAVIQGGKTQPIAAMVMVMGLILLCTGTTAWGVEYWGLTTAYATRGGGWSTENTALGPWANASTYSGGVGVFGTAVGASSTARGDLEILSPSCQR